MAKGMLIDSKQMKGSNLEWILRCAQKYDANELSKLRVLIDGETEHMDREPGEDYLSEKDFEEVIMNDLLDERGIFLVAEVHERIVGYARCKGKSLSRFKHQAEFGICILKEYWGCGIGKQLLSAVIYWADEIGIEKITLTVVETNTKAVQLYKQFGFIQEGLLIRDRLHKDSKFYNTVIMARFRS